MPINVRVPEVSGRVLDASLDTIASEGQRVVDVVDWMLVSLRLVREILGVVVDRNEMDIPDPTDAILGDVDIVRVPNL